MRALIIGSLHNWLVYREARKYICCGYNKFTLFICALFLLNIAAIVSFIVTFGISNRTIDIKSGCYGLLGIILYLYTVYRYIKGTMNDISNTLYYNSNYRIMIDINYDIMTDCKKECLRVIMNDDINIKVAIIKIIKSRRQIKNTFHKAFPDGVYTTYLQMKK